MKVVIIMILVLCACAMSACGGQSTVTPDPDPGGSQPAANTGPDQSPGPSSGADPSGGPSGSADPSSGPDSGLDANQNASPGATPDPDLPTGTETNTPAIYRRINAVDAKAMMDSGDPYILLDVRTLEEYTESRIEGAMLIPYDEIAARAESELPDKAALILIYCRSGRRSATAAETLVGMGYTNVFDFGGILDWPYDTVT